MTAILKKTPEGYVITHKGDMVGSYKTEKEAMKALSDCDVSLKVDKNRYPAVPRVMRNGRSS